MAKFGMGMTTRQMEKGGTNQENLGRSRVKDYKCGRQTEGKIGMKRMRGGEQDPSSTFLPKRVSRISLKFTTLGTCHPSSRYAYSDFTKLGFGVSLNWVLGFTEELCGVGAVGCARGPLCLIGPAYLHGLGGGSEGSLKFLYSLFYSLVGSSC